jgi:phage baseplate assembly protein gpV
MKRVTFALIGAALFAAGVTGCGGSDSSEARVRVYHASPDAPNVDVLVDGGRILENVPYTVASGFLHVEAGSRRFQVQATGTDITVIDAPVTLEDDTDYVVIASNKLAAITPIVVTADRSTPAAGQARLRVFHGAPSAPSVDVYVTAPGANIASATPVLSNVPFGAVSDYLTVPAGSYDVKVTVAGTKTVAIKVDNLSVTAGLVAMVAALDAKGAGAPFSLAVLGEN